MNPLEELERIHKEATPGPFYAEIGTDGVSHASGHRTELRAGGVVRGSIVARTDSQSLSGRSHRPTSEQEANARILALSRNIVGPVIELARTAEQMRVALEAGRITNTGRLFAALDALLRAIESEVPR